MSSKERAGPAAPGADNQRAGTADAGTDLSLSLQREDLEGLISYLDDEEAKEKARGKGKPKADPMLGMQVGNCRVAEVIGRGGFGVVYLAKHLFLDINFALKVLPISAFPDDDAVHRFHREGQTLSTLRHPRIVRLLDFGILPHRGLYLMMEFLDGQNLRQAMKGGEFFSLRRISNLFVQLCEVLAYLHAAGVIHRDLKPGNIFLLRDEQGSEHIKLIDFGLVSLADKDSITETGTYLGTAKYIAPEQIQGRKELDGRTDLYALGILLYQLLTGEHPFPPASPYEIIHHHVHTTPPALAEKVPRMSWAPVLESFVQRALAKTPEERFPDAGAFWEACAEALLAQEALMPLAAPSATGSTRSKREQLIASIKADENDATGKVLDANSTGVLTLDDAVAQSRSSRDWFGAPDSLDAVTSSGQVEGTASPPLTETLQTDDAPPASDPNAPIDDDDLAAIQRAVMMSAPRVMVVGEGNSGEPDRSPSFDGVGYGLDDEQDTYFDGLLSKPKAPSLADVAPPQTLVQSAIPGLQQLLMAGPDPDDDEGEPDTVRGAIPAAISLAGMGPEDLQEVQQASKSWFEDIKDDIVVETRATPLSTKELTGLSMAAPATPSEDLLTTLKQRLADDPLWLWIGLGAMITILGGIILLISD